MVAVSESAVARVIGIETAFKNLRGGVKLLPMRIAVIGQGSTLAQASYTTDKVRVLTPKFVGDNYGYGSPLHLAVKELLPANGDGVGIIPVTIFPLKDGPLAIASTGSITPVGVQTETQTYIIEINNIKSQAFVLLKDAIVSEATAAITAAINAIIDMPVNAIDNGTDVELVAKWKGSSGNDIFINIVGTVAGIDFTIVQPTGGTINPDVDTALSQIGNIWETLVINCMEAADTDSLDKYNQFFEPRWGALVRKPAIVFTSTVETDVLTAIITPEANKTVRTNCFLSAPGSKHFPAVITARMVSRIAVVANENPPLDYAGQKINGIEPGAETDQWDYLSREVAVTGGCSTVEIVDNIIELSDTVTFYHPTGEDPPAYRYVNDIIKVMNVVFNLSLIFEADAWKGKVLIPDNQATVNPDARKPKSAVSDIAKMIDGLALEAIISDPEAAKKTIVAGISPSNPRRLDVDFTYQISGNTTIISIIANFGFYFGTPV